MNLQPVFSTLVAGLVALSASSLAASPVILCTSDTEGWYGYSKTYSGGLRMYLTNHSYEAQTPKDALLFAHCPSKSMLRVELGQDEQDLAAARRILDGILTDGKRMTVKQAAYQLRQLNFDVTRERVTRDGCMCSENL